MIMSEESERKVGNAKGSYGWGQNFTENSFEYQEQEGKGTWRKFYILHVVPQVSKLGKDRLLKQYLFQYVTILIVKK